MYKHRKPIYIHKLSINLHMNAFLHITNKYLYTYLLIPEHNIYIYAQINIYKYIRFSRTFKYQFIF